MRQCSVSSEKICRREDVRDVVACHSGSVVFLGLETSELCWRGPEREGSAQLGRRGVAAGEEGVLLGAEIESTTNKTP